MKVKAQHIKIHGMRLQQCLKWNRALNAYIKKNITKKKQHYKRKNITFGYNTLFMQSPVDGHLSCFYFMAIVINATVNIHVQVFVWP